MSVPQICWTRESLLEAAGFRPDKDLRRAITRTRQALNACMPTVTVTKGDMSRTQGGEADHAIRLKAADHIFTLADVKPKASGPSLTGGGSLTIVWDTSAKEIPPASPLTALNSTFSEDSNGSPASSAIADGERPPSA